MKPSSDKIKDILDFIIENKIVTDEILMYSKDTKGNKKYSDGLLKKYQEVTDYILDIEQSGRFGLWFCSFHYVGFESYTKWVEYNGKIIEISLTYGQGTITSSRVVDKAEEAFTDITARQHTYKRFPLDKSLEDTNVIALLTEKEILDKVEEKIKKDSLRKFLSWNNANVHFYDGYNYDLYESYLCWNA